MNVTTTPDEMARDLVESADSDWLRQLVDALDREVRTRPLERLVALWDLSHAAAARLFGVSRQAFSKWMVSGPPAHRVDDIVAVDNITSLLDRYVKREHIPAVVRRAAPGLDGRSLIESLEQGEYKKASSMITAAFDLRRVQP